MAAPYTLKSDLDADVQVYYNKTMLETLMPRFFYYNHCDKQFSGVPVNAGEVIEYRRYPRLTAQTTALSATSDGSGKVVTRSKIRATVLEYGDHTILPKIVSVTDKDPEVEGNIKDTFSRQAAESYDTITREVMIAGSQSRVANGKTTSNILSTDVATAVDVKKLSAKLRLDNVGYYEGDMFHGIFSPATMYDLTSDTASGGFVDINKYDNSGALRKATDSKGLRGVIDSVALYETALTKSEVFNSVTCYHNLIMGHQAFACPEVDALKMGVTVIPPVGSTVDTHKRFTVVSWYGVFVPVSLDTSGASSKNIRSWDLITAGQSI